MDKPRTAINCVRIVMVSRQKELFKNIVEEYIKTALPVGSRLIVDKYNLDVSSATVRNDMMELENQGLITHPYTSAGRVPTENGYRYYVENFVNLDFELSEDERDEIEKKIIKYRNNEIHEIEDKIKSLAKILSDKSGLMVFVAFDKNNFYYTGLSNLFSQPEFQNLNLVCSLSQIIDRLDEVVSEIYDIIDNNDNVVVKIGKDNAFGKECSSIMRKIGGVLIGIVGPTRMDYDYNVGLMNFVGKVISNQ